MEFFFGRRLICCCSRAKLYLTICDPMNCSTPGFPVLHYLLELAQTHVHWVSDAIQPYYPLSSPSLPFSFFPASGSFPMNRLFASSGQSIGASASASVLPMNIQGWFPLRIDWLISLQSKKTLKSLLQHHNLKVSVLAHLASFIVLLSYLYMTTGKTIPLTIWSFVSEVIFAF